MEEQTEQTEEHHLGVDWVIWEHRNDCTNYEDNLNKVTEFNTVEQFWRVWFHLPRPFEFFFTQKDDRNLISNRSVVSYSIFKKGILPKWEDPIANKGGEWRIRRFKCLEELDYLWEEVTLTVIGNSFTNYENILGIRVVDSSQKKLNKVLYNIEIWFDSMDHAEKIKQDISEKIPEIDSAKMYLRNHS
tara:strand:+ start:3439 stop:4002 length:564 start_codon:yes stop_codon:yes gene_type:complete